MGLGFCVFGAKRSSGRWFGIAQRLRPGTPTGAQLTTGGLKSQTRSESGSVFGSIDCISAGDWSRQLQLEVVIRCIARHDVLGIQDVRVVYWYSCVHYSNTTLSLRREISQVRGQRRIRSYKYYAPFLAYSTYCCTSTRGVLRSATPLPYNYMQCFQ